MQCWYNPFAGVLHPLPDLHSSVQLITAAVTGSSVFEGLERQQYITPDIAGTSINLACFK
jgi:hypothetical protein